MFIVMSMSSYCLIMYLPRANWHSSATMTDIFPCFFLSCKANLLLQSALQPSVGFSPAQLSLSLLSRKVFTECCCQQHVKPKLGGPVITAFQLSPQGTAQQANPSNGRWNCGREMVGNFAESGDFHLIFGFFYMS